MAQTKPDSSQVVFKPAGAVGDGVTDDTAAIQIALNSSIGKTVHFPNGTYIIGSRISVPSNIRITGNGKHSIIKLKPQSWTESTGLMFELNGDINVTFELLTFDGNKGFVGTTRSPLIVIYLSQHTKFDNCTFQNVEGICTNISNDCDDTEFLYCHFLGCGGNPNNSDGYRKQAIAFSSDGIHRARGIKVIGCYFRRQGLDCISLNDCDDVVIANNTVIECYTFVYNNPLPRVTRNLVITGNAVRKCSEFGAATAVVPNALDLPSVEGLTVSGNIIYEVDACGIGLYAGTKNATVSGNTIVNPMMAGGTAFRAGLFVGDTNATMSLDSISIEGNLIIDTSNALMDYGIVVKSDTTNIYVKDNQISGDVISRYGQYTGDPFTGNIFAFTSSSQVSSSCRIVDLDVANNLETVHGRLNVRTTDNTNAAVMITQLGLGDALRVEDEASPDATRFAIDNNGNLGVRIAPATFGGPLSVSGTGNNNLSAFQAYGADAAGVVIAGNKTRNISPYGNDIVQNGDVLIRCEGRGDDGSAYRQAAYIQVIVDGPASVGSMPGRIDFYTTPSGAVSSIQHLSLKNTGALRFIPKLTPQSPEAGDIYYDSGTNKLRCYNGATWNDLF